MSEMDPSNGIPSTIISGELLALIDPIPLIRIVDSLEAGSPEDDMTWTPGAVPANALVTLVATRDSMSLIPTIEADPVNELRVAVP